VIERDDPRTLAAIGVVAACLASIGQRVLMIDLDPQANATSSLGVDKAAPIYSIYHALVDGVPRILNLRMALEVYVAHQVEVITRPCHSGATATRAPVISRFT